MKKIFFLLLIVTIGLTGADYQTPYFQKNNTRSPLLRYGWMGEKNSAILYIDFHSHAYGFNMDDEVERYLKLKMRNFYRDLKFVNSSISLPPTMTITMELQPYKNNSKLYYGFIMFSYVPHELARTNLSRNYRIVNSIIGKKYQIKNLIKKNIDLFVENFAEDTYKMQDLVDLDKKKNK